MKESLKIKIYVALNWFKINENILFSKPSEYMPPALFYQFASFQVSKLGGHNSKP